MNEKTIVSMSLSEALLQRDEGRTDWDRLRREEQAGIEPKSDPDEGEFDEAGGRFIERHRKQAISVRLDQDVLEFFKSGGPGYQTRMNAVLRSYMHDCRAACEKGRIRSGSQRLGRAKRGVRAAARGREK